MQQPRYFSTQPSANAVPAQQVMAMMPPQQQGHMVANGAMVQQQQQPMMYAPMMPGQQMMQPMMYPNMMPMQHANKKQVAPVQQQVQEATLPNNVQPKLEHAPAQKQFTVVGVTNPHLLHVDAPQLSWQMTKQGGNYVYSYDPAGQVHNVSVKFGDNHVEGSPFQLVPKAMKAAAEKAEVSLDFHPENPHHLVASGVADVDKLHFKTDMAYKLMSDSADANKFHFKYEPNGAIHQLDVSYNGEPVNNGQFEFVPKAMRPQREAEAKVEALEREYKASLKALKAVKLNAGNNGVEEEVEAEAKLEHVREVRKQVEPTRVRKQLQVPVQNLSEMRPRFTKPKLVEEAPAATEETETRVAAHDPHMTQTAPKASFGPMVMSSAQQQPMMAQQQPMMAQPMMAQQQPMMMPMQYAGGNMAPPMYQMMPAQAMHMQAQQPMYRQG